jgi:hypothetical protein
MFFLVHLPYHQILISDTPYYHLWVGILQPTRQRANHVLPQWQQQQQKQTTTTIAQGGMMQGTLI